MKKFIIFLILYLLLLISIYTDESAGKEAAAFLFLPVGARQAALGGAFASITSDATAAYYNPAGLVTLQRNNAITRNALSAMHTELWTDIKYDYVGYVHRLNKRALGISLIRLDAGTQEARDNSGKITGYFTCDDTAIILSYAQGIKIYNLPLSIGITLKHIKQEIWNEEGKATDLDIGLLFTPIRLSNYPTIQPITIGLMFTNILSSNVSWSTGNKDPLPFLIKFATSYMPSNRLLFSLDAEKILKRLTSGSTDWLIHYGLEYTLVHQPELALRIGSDDGNLTTGLGISYQTYSFDYAYITHEKLNNKHRLSVNIKF